MKRIVSLLIISAAFGQLVAAAPRSIRVTGPTIIAFFPPVTAHELEQDSETNDSLDDFQVYVREARGTLENAGIQLHEVYAHHFRVSVRGRATTFTPGKIGVGYYFVAPGKKPLLEYGVETDEDLFRTATRYFGIIVKR